MDTARAGRADAAVDGPAALPLVRAAAALRWTRPDLTATLAELALESAPDAETWVAAAGWLLHGRAALGDGRDTASALLDGLDRWGAVAAVVMRGPDGRRLRVELAGLARRIGEASVARTLLAPVPGPGEADPELRADALTELARCAVDDAPESVDDALAAAEGAWRAAGCAPGVATLALLRAARNRRAARAEVAAAEAVDGLATVAVRGRRVGATAADHVAAALTAEWIAALVDGGRLDEARGEGLAAANRLVATARPSRQVAGLRLAIARLTAVEESPDAVLAALEPAAQAAADSDVPELESACRAMLGELHEAAGRLDAAVAALRGALAADRRDRDRAAHLRAHLAGAVERWAGGPVAPGSPAVLRATVPDGATRPPQPETADRARTSAAAAAAASGEPVDRRRDAGGPAGPGGSHAREGVPSPSGDVAGGPVAPARGTGRRARRLAAEAVEGATGGRDDSGGPPSGRGAARSAAEGRGADAGRAGTVGAPRHGADTGATPVSRGVPGPGGAMSGFRLTEGGSLIGDALLRELAGGDRTASGAPSPTGRDAAVGGPTAVDDRRAVARGAADDPLFGPLRADGSREPRRDPVEPHPADARTVRWDRSTGRPPSIDDTVVLGAPAAEQPHPPTRRSGAGGDGPPASPSAASGPTGPTHDHGAHEHGAHEHGAHEHGAHGNGTHRNGAVRPQQDSAPDPATTADTPGGAADGDANGSRPGRRGTSGRGPGRPPSTDTDGLGLADLLAGALAAYRDL